MKFVEPTHANVHQTKTAIVSKCRMALAFVRQILVVVHMALALLVRHQLQYVWLTLVAEHQNVFHYHWGQHVVPHHPVISQT